MKTSIVFFATAFLGIFSAATAAAQTEPTMLLVTSIQMKGATSAQFLPQGKLETSYWDEEIARVEIFIEAPGFSRAQLKALLPLGIFNLKAGYAGDTISFDMPGLQKIVSIGGKGFLPTLSFKVTLPRYVKIEQPKPAPDALAAIHEERN